MPLTSNKLRIIKLCIERCNIELSSYPDNYGYILLRGLLFNLVGRYEDALKDLNKVIEADPEDYTGYFLRGDTLFKQGNITDAQNDLIRGLKIQVGVSEPGMKEITNEKILELIVLGGDPNKRVSEILNFEKNTILAQSLSSFNWSEMLNEDDLELLKKN